MRETKLSEAFQILLKQKEVTQAMLAKRLGISTQAMWDRLRRDNLGVSVLNEILQALDYEVVIRPVGKKTSNGELVIK